MWPTGSSNTGADWNAGCDKYQTNGEAVWFKVAEAGLIRADADCMRNHHFPAYTYTDLM